MIEVICRNRGEQRVVASRIDEVRMGAAVVMVTESGALREVEEGMKQPKPGDWLLITDDGVAVVITDEQYQQRCTPVGESDATD